MRLYTIKKLTKNSVVLSVSLHLLFLLFLFSISTVISFSPLKKDVKKTPQLYIPSYVYHGTMTPPAQQQTSSNIAHAQPETGAQNRMPEIQKVQNKPAALPTQQGAVSKAKSDFMSKNILAMSRNMIEKNQVNTALNNLKESEPPILLIGDKHAIVDPLTKLLGRSLSAHFHYPKIEGTFGVRGRVYVELVLHPEGYFSNVQIIQSSENQDFDAAALYAVNTAPTVVGANKFLARAQRFVVGFIFD